MSIPSWCRVGAKVVCIELLARVYAETVPVVGETYTIRDVRDYGDVVGILVSEIRNAVANYDEGDLEPCFIIEAFRPLITLEDDLKAHFEQHLRAPSNQKADA